MYVAGKIAEADLWRYAATLAPLAGVLDGREARAALAGALLALGGLLPDLAQPARLLAALNAMSATRVRCDLQLPSYCQQSLSPCSHCGE